MINKMREDLIKQLKKAEKSLQENKKIGMERMEQLGDDIVNSFERAINSIDFKTNILEELKVKRDQLKKWKISWTKTIFPLKLKYILSMPFIYGMIIPGLIFHIGLEIYHQICFRLYGIPRVKAKDYFVYDRHRLPQLNWFEKVNCAYCSYFNNLIRYAAEISGRTERYWCPIKHATHIKKAHSQYNKFSDYLDAKDFRENWKELRDFNDVQKSKDKKCDFVEKKKKK